MFFTFCTLGISNKFLEIVEGSRSAKAHPAEGASSASGI